MSASTSGTASTTGTSTNMWSIAEQMTATILAEQGGMVATYSRPGSDTAAITLTVTAAGETAQTVDEYGVPSAPEGQDFICASANLQAFWPPQIGDRLTCDAGSFVIGAPAFDIVTRTSAALIRLHTTRA